MMYEITKDIRYIDGIKVTTYSREICHGNVLRVEAGTNGYQGEDSEHRSRTYFRIEDEAGTAIRVRPIGWAGDEGVEIILGGDCELATIITALKFITRVLEMQSEEVDD